MSQQKPLRTMGRRRRRRRRRRPLLSKRHVRVVVAEMSKVVYSHHLGNPLEMDGTEFSRRKTEFNVYFLFNSEIRKSPSFVKLPSKSRVCIAVGSLGRGN